MNYSLKKIDLDTELLKKIIQNNILLYFVVLLLFLKIAAVSVNINFPQNIFFADITKIALENFANQSRQSAGMPALAENEQLDQAAKLKAENMVQDNYFAHTSPTGLTPWHWFSLAGYNYKYAGENLAIGFYDSEEVYNAWLNSQEHKANILNKNYKDFGTAVLSGFGQNNAVVVVQEFGSQKIEVGARAAKVKTQTKPVQNNSLNVNNPKVNVEQPVLVNEKVLSQSIEAGSAVDYDKTLQYVTYGISFIVMGILLALIFLNVGKAFDKKLVFRCAIIVILLSLATLLNKELVIYIIPHQIII